MSISSPRVSIVIATYNRASFIGKAIESVLDQTYDSYEIIIVDDGSTDETLSVVSKYESSRIKYIYQENSGRSSARNTALSLIQGEYVAFLDSDDMFLPQKLELQVELLENNPDFGMSYTSARVSDEHGNEIIKDGAVDGGAYYLATDSGWLHDKIAFYLPVTILLPTVMVRKDVLKRVGGFDESLSRFEDTDLWRRISKVTQIVALDIPLTTVLTHSGNQMESPEEVYRSLSFYVRKIFNEEPGCDPLVYREGAARLFLHYGYAVKSVCCQWRLSDPFFQDAICFYPRYSIDSLLESRMMVVAQAAKLFVVNFKLEPFALLSLLLTTVKRNVIILIKRLSRGYNQIVG